jgi:FixJ family two-component response regulator
MAIPKATVFVVDDEEMVRRSLMRLLHSAGWKARGYGTGEAFLSDYRKDEPGCLLLDLRLPDRDGLQLQAELNAAGAAPPIVFLTGYGDLEAGVRAMKAGAVDFLTKPWEDTRLLEAVRQALAIDRERRCEQQQLRGVRDAYDRLTPREKEVCQLVVTGLLNKQVAYQLGVTEKTIKVHRARVMRKMGVESLAELVHLVEQLGLGLAHR